MLGNHFLLLKALDEFGEQLQKGEVPRANLEKARQLKHDHPSAFDPDAMRGKVLAAVGLCNWINDVLEYPSASIARIPVVNSLIDRPAFFGVK